MVLVLNILLGKGRLILWTAANVQLVRVDTARLYNVFK